ncbi:MAG TPA: tetratricopeptide repeat protein [Candidatus Eisenbacteria bacterium]
MNRAKRSQTQPRPQAKAKRATRRAPWLLWLGAILALTFVSYIPSLSNGFINWDDNFYVTENPLMARPTLGALLTTNLGGNYHPLTMASLVLNYKLSGLNAASYHWLNLLLHLANVALVFFFVRALSGGRLWTTAATALFFGIHPTHVESVAWISERKDVLYALFYLIALLTYLRYLEKRRILWLLATLLAFVLSAASKPAAVVLPLSLLAIDYFRRRPFSARVVWEKVPFFAISMAVGLLTFKAQQSVGAVADAKLWDPFQRVLFASFGTVMYLVKLFLPFHLSAVYPLPSTGAARFGSEYYAAPVILAVLLPTIAFLCRRVRPVLFGLAFFFINIVLVLQLVTVGAALMADRYTYVPYIGLFFALAWWLDEPSARVPFPVKPLIAGIFLVLLPISIVQTWNRCRVWRDPLTFWNDTIQKYPRQIVEAYYNRGNYYGRTGRPQEALADYKQALALNSGVTRIWYNRGLLFSQLGHNDSALVDFDHAVKLSPKHVDAWNNRGAMKYRTGDLAGAAADFTRAMELNPRYRDAYLNRATVLYDMREYEKSIADRRRGIELDPGNPAKAQEHALLADALQRLNRHQEAIAEIDKAIGTARAGDQRIGGYYLARSQAWWALRDRGRALADAREAERLGAKVDPAYLRGLGG